MKHYFDKINITHEPFSIPKIRSLLNKYIRHAHNAYGKAGFRAVDPFARNSFTIQDHNFLTNDLNPEFDTDHNLEFNDFGVLMETLGKRFQLVLFDPPYNLTLLKKHYDGIGKELKQWQTHAMWKRGKDALARCVTHGGIVVSFGYNTKGFGHRRGFEKIAIYNFECHAREDQYNLLVTVEQKLQYTLDDLIDDVTSDLEHPSQD